MSSNDTQQNTGYCRDRSLNTVLDEYPALSALSGAHFICGEPRWLSVVSHGLFLLSGCGLAYLATPSPTIPFVVTLLLWIVSGLAIVVAVRPSSGSIHFASDPQGVYFPSRQRLGIVGPSMPQTWLFVPWSNISSISVQLLLDESGNTKGVTFCLRASEEERRVYFSGTAKLDFDERSPIDNRGLILVGYPSAFKSPYKIVAMLCRFQRRQTDKIVTLDDVTLLTEH